MPPTALGGANTPAEAPALPPRGCPEPVPGPRRAGPPVAAAGERGAGGAGGAAAAAGAGFSQGKTKKKTRLWHSLGQVKLE